MLVRRPFSAFTSLHNVVDGLYKPCAPSRVAPGNRAIRPPTNRFASASFYLSCLVQHSGSTLARLYRCLMSNPLHPVMGAFVGATHPLPTYPNSQVNGLHDTGSSLRSVASTQSSGIPNSCIIYESTATYLQRSPKSEEFKMFPRFLQVLVGDLSPTGGRVFKAIRMRARGIRIIYDDLLWWRSQTCKIFCMVSTRLLSKSIDLLTKSFWSSVSI